MNHNQAAIAVILFATAALVSGCTLEDPVGTVAEGRIIAIFPDEGAAAVPLNVIPLVEVADESTPLDVTLEDDAGTSTELSCAPSSSAGLLKCLLPQPLEPDRYYTLTAQVADSPTTAVVSNFSTGYPTGLGYEVAGELQVLQFGGMDMATSVFNSLVSGDAPLLLVSENVYSGGDLPSVGSNWVWGPGAYIESEDNYAINRDVGYPMATLTLVDEHGTVFGSSSHAFLPVWINDHWMPVRVDDLVMRGSLSPFSPGLPVSELTVEANLPATTLDRIAADLDETNADLLHTLVEMDTDTDLDGEPDAAHLVLSTSALPAAIHSP